MLLINKQNYYEIYIFCIHIVCLPFHLNYNVKCIGIVRASPNLLANYCAIKNYFPYKNYIDHKL